MAGAPGDKPGALFYSATVARPTLTTLIQRTRSDIQQALVGVNASLKRTIERALALAIAGVAHGLYGGIETAERRSFIQTADEEGLARHGVTWDLPRKGPVLAKAVVLFFADPGASIPAGYTLVKQGSTEQYTTDAIGLEADGQIFVSITAVAPGPASSLAVTEPVQLGAPLAGVFSPGGVTEVIQDGADEEAIEDWRQRLLDRVQQQPKGGANGDYFDWAKETPGVPVSRAWEQGLWMGPGTVRLIFVTDSTDPITPSPAALAAVTAYMEDQKPITAQLTVVGGIEQNLDPILTISPDTAQLRQAVENQIAAFLFQGSQGDDAEIIPGGTMPISGTVDNPGLVDAIKATPGLDEFALLSPLADVDIADTSVLVVGTIQFQ